MSPVDQGAPLVDVMVVLVAGGRHRVADHGAVPVECVRRNPGASRRHQVSVLHGQLGRRLLPRLDLEVAGGHLDADLVLQCHVRRRQVLGHRPDHGPDPVVAVMGRRLGGEPIEQLGVGGQVEPTFDLGVGQGVAHALGEGSVPVRPVDADPCLRMADAAAQRRHPGVGVGREPGTDAASLVGRVHPDPDASDLEVVVQGSGDHQLTGHHLARERAVPLAELAARAGGEEHRHAVLAGVERGLGVLGPLGRGVHALEGVHVGVVARVDRPDHELAHAGHGVVAEASRANGLSACRVSGRTRVRVRWCLQTTPSGGSPQPAPRIARVVGGPV